MAMRLPPGVLPPLPTLSEMVRLYGLSSSRQLSQNFIFDSNVTDRLARQLAPLRHATVLEVGPGPGGLTRSLFRLGAKKVIVVEKDKRFLPALEVLQQAVGGPDRLDIVFGDCLKVDEAALFRGAEKTEWEADDTNVKVIGNLPFNVATELLLKWLRQLSTQTGLFSYGRVPLVLTFQKEVAQRITAAVGSKQFSRLSVMTQCLADARLNYVLHSKVFVPPPEVEGAVVSIKPRITPFLSPEVPFQELEWVLRETFGQKRKIMSNSVKTWPGGSQCLQRSGIPPHLRPEQVDVEAWVRLALTHTQSMAPSPSHDTKG